MRLIPKVLQVPAQQAFNRVGHACNRVGHASRVMHANKLGHLNRVGHTCQRHVLLLGKLSKWGMLSKMLYILLNTAQCAVGCALTLECMETWGVALTITAVLLLRSER